MVFVIGHFEFEVVCINSYDYYLVLDKNICWNHKFCSVRNDVCTTYSSDNQLYIFESKNLQFPLKHWFTMTISKSQWETLKITGVELGLDCFSQGSVTWCVRVVSSHQNLVILPPSSKMVKNIIKKGNSITYSNYSPFVLSLSVYLKEYLSCEREFLPFLSTLFVQTT